MSGGQKRDAGLDMQLNALAVSSHLHSVRIDFLSYIGFPATLIGWASVLNTNSLIPPFSSCHGASCTIQLAVIDDKATILGKCQGSVPKAGLDLTHLHMYDISVF